jgi:hypothetical protein
MTDVLEPSSHAAPSGRSTSASSGAVDTVQAPIGASSQGHQHASNNKQHAAINGASDGQHSSNATSASRTTPPSTIPPSAAARRLADHLSLIKAQLAASASNTPASAHAPSAGASLVSAPGAFALTLACHCLIVDTALIDAIQPDERANMDRLQHMAALQTDDNTAQGKLVDHMEQWMPSLKGLLGAAYVHEHKGKRDVHLNFASEAQLAAALLANPLLVRCGTQEKKAWGAAHACGPPRHHLPEMLQFTCQPTMPKKAEDLPAALDQLLGGAEMNLPYTARWHPNSSDPRWKPTTSITFNVLPRDISQAHLAAFIDKVHTGNFTLWGGRVHVHAPNTPSLTRCRGCQCLGHRAEHCPVYKGIPLRFLFKEPVSYLALRELITRCKAKGGYLGSSVDTRVPQRKVTLLFQGDPQDEAAAEQMMTAAADTIEELVKGSVLREQVTIVRPKDRLLECKLCSSTATQHDCPFQPQQQYPVGHGQGARKAPGDPRPPAAEHDPQDRMCRAWRMRGSCQRKTAGEHCRWEHPAGHVPTPSPCFMQKDRGQCTRVDCQYAHSVAQPEGKEQEEKKQQEPAAAPAVPAAPQSQPAAAAAAPASPTKKRRGDTATAPASSSSASADVDMSDRRLAPQTPSKSNNKRGRPPGSAKKKGGNQYEVLSQEDDDEKEAAPAAAPPRLTAATPMSSMSWGSMNPSPDLAAQAAAAAAAATATHAAKKHRTDAPAASPARTASTPAAASSAAAAAAAAASRR